MVGRPMVRAVSDVGDPNRAGGQRVASPLNLATRQRPPAAHQYQPELAAARPVSATVELAGTHSRRRCKRCRRRGGLAVTGRIHKGIGVNDSDVSSDAKR